MERPPVPVAEQVATAILDKANALAPAARVEFSLRLDPPDLGPVQVHLAAGQDGISARLVVQDAATRQLLQGQMPLLRQRLEQAGVTLYRLDLSVASQDFGGFDAEPPRLWPAQTSARRKPAPGGATAPDALIDVVA